MALLLLAPLRSAGQETFGLRAAGGWQGMAGDLGGVFDGAVDFEFSILIPVGQVRVGGGSNIVSLAMDQVESTWSQVRFHALVGYPFARVGPFRPYAEARYTFRRLRPEDDRYFGGEDELLRDFVASGSGFEVVAGTEVALTGRLSLDLSGAVGMFTVSPDLRREGLGEVDSGTSWRLHAGIAWFPTRPVPGGGR